MQPANSSATATTQPSVRDGRIDTSADAELLTETPLVPSRG
jgi:hypothetical protein